MCRQVNADEELHEVHPTVLLLAGGMAGICAWIVTYPVDIIKSRIQADMTGKYSGLWDCLKQSYQESGMMSFTRGLAPTLLRAFPTNAATFGGVALTLHLLKLFWNSMVNIDQLEQSTEVPADLPKKDQGELG